MLELLFRKGFPQNYVGQYEHYKFEVILLDGSFVQAVVHDKLDGNLRWRIVANNILMDIISEDQVLGWRETYNCPDARMDMEAYFNDPNSIVTKDHLSDALRRHIDREPCPDCRRYYEEKSKPKAPSPISRFTD